MSLKINDNIDLPNSITAHNRISLNSVSVGGGGASPELIARVAKLERTVTKQQGAIEEMDRDLDGVHGTLEEVGSDISELDTAMTAAEGEIGVIHNKDAAQDIVIASKQDQLTFDATPTEDSGNPVTSDGIFKSLADVIEIAEGKTNSFTLSTQTIGNEAFNSQAGFIEVESFTDINGNEVTADELKIGDIILVTELDVPDRWVGTVGQTVVLYRMETAKVDLSGYYTKGEADTLLAGKVDNATLDDYETVADHAADLENYPYKFFHHIKRPVSQNLTQQEVNDIVVGACISDPGESVDTVYFPACHAEGYANVEWYGWYWSRPRGNGGDIAFGVYTIRTYDRYLSHGTLIAKNLRAGNQTYARLDDISISRDLKWKNKSFPNYPTTNANPANLQIAPNGGNLSWKEFINNLASEYDATATYAVGDVCMHDGALYQCTTAIATAEAWDATHWTQVKVDDVYANAAKIASGNVPQDGILGIDANNNIVKGSLLGKYVRIMPAPSSRNLTADEVTEIIQGVLVNGTAHNVKNPFFFPMGETSAQYTGAVAYGDQGKLVFKYAFINKVERVLGYGVPVLEILPDRVSISKLVLASKTVPDYPQGQVGKKFHYVLDNGTLAWQEPQYGPSVSDNAITELTYEKISVINVAAARTFTLKTAQTDCIPEYRATITNIGSANVILTFTGITAIKTNDPNITVTGNSLVLPPSTTIEVSAYNGHLIAFNWSV